MSKENKDVSTSHGQSGDAPPTPVPQHKTFGGGKRDEVAGGPAGRGNDTGATVDTSRNWGSGDRSPTQKQEPNSAKPANKA